MKRELANIRADIDQFNSSHGIAAKPTDDTRERLQTILLCFDGVEEGSAANLSELIAATKEYEDLRKRHRLLHLIYLGFLMTALLIAGGLYLAFVR